MKYLCKYNLFFTENTIGSDEIWKKYYTDIDKKVYYRILNIDPTSIRKKEFSKPGKYSKWLLLQYRKEKKEEEIPQERLQKRIDMYSSGIDDLIFDDGYCKRLREALYIFSTKLGKSILKKSGKEIDILKYKSFSLFSNTISNIEQDWTLQSEKGKIDLIYEDQNIKILIPLNFTACYEYSKHTDWCSKTKTGYEMWSRIGLMYRFVNKHNDKRARLTWNKDGKYSWAAERYPEISDYSLEAEYPFNFAEMDAFINKKITEWDEEDPRKDRYSTLKSDFWKYISPQSINLCISYYQKFINK